MRLNIQLFAKSGTIDGTSTASNCDCRVTWKEISRDTTANTITISVTSQIYRSGSSSTTGTFSGTIKVDGTSYFISKKFSPYTWGSWGTVATKTITISNASNKSVSIDLKLTQTGTSMTGTYTAKGNAQLDILHKLPEINSIGLSEQNLIVQMYCQNNFMLKSSKIKFNLEASAFEGANITKYIIKFNNYVVESSTNEFILDTKNFDISFDETNFVYFKVQVQDSNNSLSEVQDINVAFLPYSLPSLINTACFVKRDGQQTGKANLTINGIFYNEPLGTLAIDNKINISYKFWEKGDEEPINYIDIDESNINIDGNSFNVEELPIGSINEQDANWFNPKNSYNVRIKVSDTMWSTSTLEEPLIILRGSPVWKEYKNRVDFDRLQIKGEEVYSSIPKPISATFTSDTNSTASVNSAYRIGKIVTMSVRFTLKQNVSAGSNIYSGTCSIKPISQVTGVAYQGSNAQVLNFSSNGSITVRQTGSGSISSGSSINIGITFFISEEE